MFGTTPTRAILATILVFTANALENQGAPGYTQPNIFQKSDDNFCPKRQPLQKLENIASPFSDQQFDGTLWGVLNLAGVLIIVSGTLMTISGVLLCPRYHTDLENKSVVKGRNAAIVAVCDPHEKDNLSRSTTEGVSHAVRRGKQPASQDSGGGQHPAPSSYEHSYKLRIEKKNSNEFYATEGLKKAGTCVAREAGRSLSVDQEEKTDVHQELYEEAQISSQSDLSATTHSFEGLKRSLFGSVRWFILFVAVNYGPVDDPEKDMGFWIGTLWDSTHQRVTFRSCSGARATRENIKQVLGFLYYQAYMVQGMGRSNLFIYLTGEGDGKGGMALLDGTSIDRAYIDLCLRELEESHQGGLAQTPVVQFDMCRYGVDPGKSIAVLGVTNKGIDAFYSCSAGEGALAMEFSPETLLSAYSLAFIMASCDLARSSSNSPHESTTADLDTLKKAMQWRLHQLTNVVNLARRSGRPSGIFHMIFYMLSKSSSIFKLPDLIPQSPDWGEASNLDLIIELSLMISEMKQVRQVYDKITNHIYFRMANPPLVSTSNHDPPPRTRTTQHHRGASPNVLLANSQRKSNIIEA